ncbi:MAG: hypothetical protein M1823_008042, partial [Watsoniomyces obsoletus]
MSRRGLTVVGLADAGGVGYYLYNAGGDPKVAKKNVEADAAKAERKLKNEAPGREAEAKKKGEELATRAGNHFDRAVADGNRALKDAETKAAEYADKTGKELKQSIDKFDKTVERKTSEAKGGISSWFGG